MAGEEIVTRISAIGYEASQPYTVDAKNCFVCKPKQDMIAQFIIGVGSSAIAALIIIWALKKHIKGV